MHYIFFLEQDFDVLLFFSYRDTVGCHHRSDFDQGTERGCLRIGKQSGQDLDNLYSNRSFEVVFCMGDQTLVQCGRLLKDLYTAKSNCELVN